MLVDDEADFRLVVGTMLADRGCVIEEAGSAEEAIARVRETPFDAVLLDNVMPGMTGAEVASELAGDPNAPQILLFSTWLPTEIEERARTLGVRAVDKLDLIAQIDGIVEGIAAAAGPPAGDELGRAG